MKTFKSYSDKPSWQHKAEPSRSFIGFDYASLSRPAKDVPCHFLETESPHSAELVFAIGDSVLGPDPLPILCLRHYLHRSLSLETSKPLVAATELNGLVYDCCAANCSLTCFYAQYNRENCFLRYVNAGHGAPVLIRSNPREVLRLERGGPVFGLQQAPRYLEGIVHLRAGDRLIAFTQGVIDSLAAQKNESAEASLISVARQHRSFSSAELANFIVATCEDSRSGVPLDGSVIVASVDQFTASTTAAVQANAVFAEE